MIVSPHIAIVSLGVSCQTAFQIEAHAKFVGERLGCEMEKRTTPFDWLYVPVAGAAAMLRDECYFPKDVGELELSQVVPADGRPVEWAWKKPFWPRYGATFWHSKFDDPATFLSKARHAADNLKRICRADRRVFIVSNTQNNIARSMRDAGREPMDAKFRDAQLIGLHAALNSMAFPSELHVVTNHDFCGDTWRGMTIHRFTPDRSTWEGDGKQWCKLFEEILT